MQVHIHIYLSNEITLFRGDNILSKSHKLPDKIPSSKHKKHSKLLVRGIQARPPKNTLLLLLLAASQILRCLLLKISRHFGNITWEDPSWI